MITKQRLYKRVMPIFMIVILLTFFPSVHAENDVSVELPYNQHDLETIQDFLRQVNGERTNAEIKGWDVNDPKTWDESAKYGQFGDIVEWVELNGELRIKKVRLSGGSGILKFSDCIALEEINVGNTNITELILSNLPALHCVACYYNKLENLDFSNLPELTSISCDRNKLTELKLPFMPKLTELNCPDNELKMLDLTSYPNLQKLDCSNDSENPSYNIYPKNQLEELDLTKVPNMRELNCSNNKITKLDLSDTPALEYLNCIGNKLTELDLHVVPKLTGLDCSGNQLTALDLSNNPKLSGIGCSNNQVTELNLSNVPELQILNCDYNRLTELDLSRVPSLFGLSCSNNQLTGINLTDVPKVFILNCSNNPFFETEQHISYIGGFPDGTFRPDELITRAQAVSLFFRLSASKNDKTPLNFNDIRSDDWYYQTVTYFKQYFGFSSENKSFEPEKPITRAEFAQIAASFVGFSTAVDVEHLWWLDAPTLIEKYWEARIESCIKSVSEQGWMTGFPDGTFRPEEPLTRAQAVKVINMMLNRNISLENISASAPQYSDLSPSHWAYADIMEASIAHDYERQEDGSEIWK